VKSLSAYRKNINRVNIDSDDSDQSITHVFQGEDQDQTSQELSLVGNFGRLSFVTGLYYLHEKVNTHRNGAGLRSRGGSLISTCH